MGLRGLPAIVRAVPARLFQRPPRSGAVRAPGGCTLLGLIGQLPPSLRDRALTHSSWVDVRTQSYERLEFLGDSVLGLAAASELCRRHPDSDEGELARMKGFVVSRASCAEVAGGIDLRRVILEQAPASLEKRQEAIANQTILGNVLEALIGACYLTHGFEQTRLAVIEAFEGQIEQAATTRVDHKTALQWRRDGGELDSQRIHCPNTDNIALRRPASGTLTVASCCIICSLWRLRLSGRHPMERRERTNCIGRRDSRRRGRSDRGTSAIAPEGSPHDPGT